METKRNRQSHYQTRRYSKAEIKRNKQCGATLVEPLIILPLFLFLLFGVIEYTYAYRVKASLNMASSEAVRMGALSNALLKPMKGALSAAMASEYMKGDDSATGLVKANARAKLLQTTIDSLNGSTVRIVSPNKSIFDEHKVDLWVRLVGDDKEKKHEVIPSDNLYWRNPVAKAVTVNGVNQNIGIQDANLLKIKTMWCHRLVTPGMDRIIHRTILLLDGSHEQKVCNNLTAASSLAGGVIPRGYYIALSSQAIMRMQTPVYYDGNNLR